MSENTAIMNTSRCRFHIVGAEPSFQTVTAVEAELLGDDVQSLYYSNWAACLPAEISVGDTVIGHIQDPGGFELFRQFVAGFQREGLRIPRVIIVANALELPQEIVLFELGITDCLIRPLNLRRFNYLLQSIYIKSKMSRASNRQAEPNPDQSVHARIVKLAGVKANVLITGETGVGKSYCAKAMHLASVRANKPFVVLNCSAIPEALFESELFGHEKGAFTGADRARVGKLEFADGGTVFLDDVDAIPLGIQAKLLHAVENHEFCPLGSNRTVKYDARLVSATNRNLETLGGSGDFRKDLMYRLNTCELHISPLRDRREEIVNLASNFIDEFAVENDRTKLEIHSDALEALLGYSWPGNIRELRNVIQSAAILTDDGILRAHDLPEKVRHSVATARASHGTHQVSSAQLGVTIPYLEEARALIAALVRHNYNRTDAAAELGYSRTTLYHKLAKLRLN